MNLKNKNILVIEDDEINFQLIKNLLEEIEEKINIKWAQSGMEGLEILESKEEFDLIFLDISLPMEDGFSISKKIRNRNILTPIIAQTGYSIPKAVKKMKDLNIDYFLFKPFSKEEFLNIVEKILV